MAGLIFFISTEPTITGTMFISLFLENGITQRYIWPWMRMVCRRDSLLQRVAELIVRASGLIDGLKGEYLLVDRAYDIQEILDKAKSQDMKIVIPAKNKEKMISIDTKLGI